MVVDGRNSSPTSASQRLGLLLFDKQGARLAFLWLRSAVQKSCKRLVACLLGFLARGAALLLLLLSPETVSNKREPGGEEGETSCFSDRFSAAGSDAVPVREPTGSTSIFSSRAEAAEAAD